MEKDRQIRIKDGYLNHIINYASDFKKYDDADQLREVIDELIGFAKLALENDDEETMYDGDKGAKHYNILGELIAEDGRP